MILRLQRPRAGVVPTLTVSLLLTSLLATAFGQSKPLNIGTGKQLFLVRMPGGSKRRYPRRLSALGVLLLVSTVITPARVVLKVGESDGVAAFPHSNGRQIARNSQGTWFVAYDGRVGGKNAIFLAASKGAFPEFAGDVHSPVLLAGGSTEAVVKDGAAAAQVASMVVGSAEVFFSSSSPYLDPPRPGDQG